MASCGRYQGRRSNASTSSVECAGLAGRDSNRRNRIGEVLRTSYHFGLRFNILLTTNSTSQNYQAALNPLVGHIVNLCLSHHDQLRENAVQILYCMIISEYHTSQTFEHIENELVSKLDVLFMSDSKGDDISRTFFISHLRHLFDSSDVDEELRNRVTSFLESVNVFLQLLLSVRALPEGEEFADDRVMATVRLIRVFFNMHPH